MYVPQLTFTRFIAALLIVFFHYAQHSFPFTNTFIHEILASSNVAVSYFFLLSGFVMIVSNANKQVVDTIDFYKKRILRIYPVYLVAMVCMLITLLFGPAGIDLTGLLANVLLIQAWIPEKALSINYPAWSISVEVFFYVVFPFIFNYIFKKYNLKQIAIFICVFFVLTQICIHYLRYSDFHDGLQTNSHRFILFFPLFHLPSFLIGNLIGQLFLNNQRKSNYTFAILTLLVLIIMCILYPSGFILQIGILSIFFGPLIYFMAKDTGVISKFFSLKPFIFLGEISYAIYILQNPVFTYMAKILSLIHITDVHHVFYVSFFALLIVSAGIYIVIEKIVYSKNVLRILIPIKNPK